jgi:4-amino-4-deoxy-L-arabinose transferase-like glycosyltransferase
MKPYLLVLAALFAAAWALGAALGPYSVGDDREYLDQAENLEAGRPPYAGDWAETPRDPARFSLRPPGYAAFLVAVRTLGESRLWLAAVQGVLGVGTWALVWVVLGAAGERRRAGPLVAGLLATPATLVYPQLAMADTLFTLLLVVALWRFAVFACDGRAREVVAVHALLAAALWVKPVVLYVWPLALAVTAWALWRRGGGWRATLPAASAVLVPAAALALALLNASWTGRAEVTSLQTKNLVQQNAYRTLMRTGETDLAERAETAAAQIADYDARQQARAAWAVDVIRDRPLAYAAVHLQGTAAFALDPGRFDLTLFFDVDASEGGGMNALSREGALGALGALGRQPPALLAALGALLVLNVAVAVAFLAWSVWGAAPVEVRVFALGLVAYLAFVSGPVGSARYRMPAAPLLALALPWAWAALRHWTSARRARP